MDGSSCWGLGWRLSRQLGRWLSWGRSSGLSDGGWGEVAGLLAHGPAEDIDQHDDQKLQGGH